jgi:hypothetical protein
MTHTKDEALKLALEVLTSHVERFDFEQFTSLCELDPAKEAIAAIKQAQTQTAPVQPVPVTLISSEQHIALREAFAINSADLYFEANPTHDTYLSRMLFERGFARGFDSHERAIETAKKGNT